MPDHPHLAELLPLAKCAFLGGAWSVVIFWMAHDPAFAVAAGVVALAGLAGAVWLTGRDR